VGGAIRFAAGSAALVEEPRNQLPDPLPAFTFNRGLTGLPEPLQQRLATLLLGGLSLLRDPDPVLDHSTKYVSAFLQDD
jgi:hypothetical protein